MSDDDDDLSRYVGRTLDDAEALAAAEGLLIRLIEPDHAYTMEYRHDRVNVTLGADGRVVTARRG